MWKRNVEEEGDCRDGKLRLVAIFILYDYKASETSFVV
jgi:hypothetical protein